MTFLAKTRLKSLKSLAYALGFLVSCLFLLCLSSFTFADNITALTANDSNWSDENVALNISAPEYPSLSSIDFYPVKMYQANIPYFNLSNIFKLLDYQVIGCSSDEGTCDIQSIPPSTLIDINLKTSTITITQNGKLQKTISFTADEVFTSNNQVWLRYDILPKMIDVKTKWDLNNFYLSVQLAKVPYSILRAQRLANISKIEAEQASQIGNNTLTYQNALQASRNFNLEAQYQLGMTEGVLGPDASASNVKSLNFNTMADIFHGTLQASGSAQIPKQSNQDISWSYNWQRTPTQDFFQAGNIISGPSMFINQTSLDNGVSYQRLQNTTASLIFTYNGQTIPGTDVEVWRDGSYLVKTFTVGTSGTYTVQDTNASPGDVYRIDYYYPNGQTDSTYVRFAPSQNLLLNPAQLDFDLYGGQLMPNTTSFGPNHFYQALSRVGITHNFTLGLGYYQLPTNNYSTMDAYYWSAVAQPFPTFNLEYDQFMNQSGQGLQATSTYFENHTLQLTYTYLSNSSPFFDLQPGVSLVNSSAKNFQVQDIMNLSSHWRGNLVYQETSLFEQTSFNASAYYSDWLSPTIGIGNYRTFGQISQPSLLLGNNFQLTENQILQLTSNWIGNNGNNQTLSYIYRQGQLTGLNYQLNLYRSSINSPTMNFSGNINWNVNPNWLLSLNAGRGFMSLGVSYVDAIGLFNHLQKPTDYGLGTISGTIMSPSIPGEASVPIEGVNIRAFGATATTNAQGQYTLSDIPPNTLVYITVDNDSLGANMIAAQNKVPVYLRPGSVLNYNPVILTTVGIDGYVLSNEPLPEGLEVTAVRDDGSDFKRTASVESYDGSYQIENLTPGTYTITLKTPSAPPKAIHLTIKPDEYWVSNINFEWQQPTS